MIMFITKVAMNFALGANTKSDQAGQEARDAKAESRWARSESAVAYQEVLGVKRRLHLLEINTTSDQARRERSESAAAYEQVLQMKRRLGAVETLANHNHERENTDDRKRRYCTPKASNAPWTLDPR
jgi:hypothetical protein